VLINEWGLEGEGMPANDGLSYPNKIPSDFQGCPFKISMSYHELPEVSHVTAFPKGYNFTPIIPFEHKTDTFLSDAIHESILSVFSKPLEKLMHNRLLPFLKRHNILTCEQHGFMESKSTETASHSFIQCPGSLGQTSTCSRHLSQRF
jgi:hypothetical protein